MVKTTGTKRNGKKMGAFVREYLEGVVEGAGPLSVVKGLPQLCELRRAHLHLVRA